MENKVHKVSDLINLLGGTGVVAKRLNIKPSAISNWKKLNKIPNNKKNDLKMLGLDLNVRTGQYLTSKNLSNSTFLYTWQVIIFLSYCLI